MGETEQLLGFTMLSLSYFASIIESFHFRRSLSVVSKMSDASSDEDIAIPVIAVNYSDIGPPRISWQKGNVNESHKRREVSAVGTPCIHGIAE